jgi:hypothetical protein
MSTLAEEPGARRVRHQAREAVAVMVFSAATSLALATTLLLVTHLSTRG